MNGWRAERICAEVESEEFIERPAYEKSIPLSFVLNDLITITQGRSGDGIYLAGRRSDKIFRAEVPIII